jgi:hypothetical protein
MREQVGDSLQRLNPRATIPGITMPATIVGEGANNHVWISYPNSSTREIC